MKAVVAGIFVALILAGGAFATGSALDPRVPALTRKVNALATRVASDESKLNGKLDKGCVDIVPMVVRPGYVYQLTNGTLVIYKAFDEYDSSIDHDPNLVMVLNSSCR